MAGRRRKVDAAIATPAIATPSKKSKPAADIGRADGAMPPRGAGRLMTETVH
jgi:hypothetical protein